MRIGVLALQGGFSLHQKKLRALDVDPIEVRTKDALFSCDGLILPGGESTTMTRLIEAEGLQSHLLAFAQKKPLFGTCAGLILMVKEKLFDITVERNAYGRQADSFVVPLQCSLPSIPHATTVSAVFIRAPRITSIMSSRVDILAQYQNEPVCIQQGHHLGATFHPELTEDLSLHAFFLELVTEKQS